MVIRREEILLKVLSLQKKFTLGYTVLSVKKKAGNKMAFSRASMMDLRVVDAFGR